MGLLEDEEGDLHAVGWELGMASGEGNQPEQRLHKDAIYCMKILLLYRLT